MRKRFKKSRLEVINGIPRKTYARLAIMMHELHRKEQGLKDMPKEVIIYRVFTGEDGGYEGYKHVMLVAAETRGKAESIIEQFMSLEPYGTGSAYDCTGRPFSDGATIKKVAPGRWLAREYVRFDV